MLNEVPSLHENRPLAYCVRPLARLRCKLRSRRVRIALLVLVGIVAWYLVALATQKDAIRQAVFRHQISPFSPHNDVYYLSIEGQRDPSAWLLAQFRGSSNPSVLPASQAPPHMGASDLIPTPAPAERRLAILSIDRINLVLPFLAVVDGRWYEAPLSASGTTYVVIWIGRGWTVCWARLNWMS